MRRREDTSSLAKRDKILFVALFSAGLRQRKGKGMTGHELAKRLLSLPDHEVITIDGDRVTEANADSYDTEDEMDLPCITLETEAE